MQTFNSIMTKNSTQKNHPRSKTRKTYTGCLALFVPRSRLFSERYITIFFFFIKISFINGRVSHYRKQCKGCGFDSDQAKKSWIPISILIWQCFSGAVICTDILIVESFYRCFPIRFESTLFSMPIQNLNGTSALILLCRKRNIA